MRRINFYNEVSEESVKALLTRLQQANAPDEVYIDSPGGRIHFFSHLGSAFQQRGITTIGGNVRSAAVVLFLLGQKRLAFPDSTFFFHEVRTLIKGDEIMISDIEEVLEYQESLLGRDRTVFEEWLYQMRSTQSWFLDFMSRTLNLPSYVFLDLMRANATLTAREAVRYGIVHGVLETEAN